MTEPVALALIGLVTLIVTTYNAYQSNKIHTAVNSNYSEIKKELTESQERNERLEQLLLNLTKSNGDLEEKIKDIAPKHKKESK